MKKFDVFRKEDTRNVILLTGSILSAAISRAVLFGAFVEGGGKR
jgi:hypothetical protein